MADDYLWDRAGTPDPEVERLERLLGPLGFGGEGRELPWDLRGSRPRSFGSRRSILAAAAGLLLAVTAVWRAGGNGGRGWDVARVEGAPLLGADRLKDRGRLAVGQWLETDGASRAEIRVGEIGEVNVEPDTRVRLIDAGVASHRLALARGAVQAKIWAPPRNFFVETRSGTAIDLGCAYRLEVDEAGSGMLRVTSGWVGFERAGRASVVPAGARCLIRPRIGPGTPVFETASPAFQRALERLDFEATSPEERAGALGTLIGEARPVDSLTLWHLLLRVEGEERARVYDRMAVLRPPPPGVTREAVLAGDREMLDRWWDALGIAEFWWQLKGGWFKDLKKVSPKTISSETIGGPLPPVTSPSPSPATPADRR